MRALDEASGGWVSFLSRESEVRYHPKRRQIDYLEKGASVVSGTFELIKSLSYSITTRAEMYDDSVRDGTYQVTVFIYTTGIQLGDKKHTRSWFGQTFRGSISVMIFREFRK